MTGINTDKQKLLENYIMLKNNFVVDDNLKIKTIIPEKVNNDIVLRVEYTIWDEFSLKEYITEENYKKISRDYEIEQILK